MTILEEGRRLYEAASTPGHDVTELVERLKAWETWKQLKGLSLLTLAEAVADSFHQGTFCDDLPKNDSPDVARLRAALAALDAGSDGR